MRRFLTKWLRGIALVLELTGLALRYRRRLLVLSRFGGIGDIICAFPAAREMTRRHPGEQVVFLTRKSFVPLIRRSGLGILCIGVAEQILPPSWAIGWIGRHIHLTYPDEDEHMAPPPETLVQAFGSTLGLGPLADQPRLEVDHDRVAQIRARLLPGDKRGLILLHTGPTWKVREWPSNSWTQLVAQLHSETGCHVLQISANRNVGMDDLTLTAIPGAAPVPCSDDIETLLHTVAAVDLLIGIDSGPIHIAAAVNTPFVSLFGPTDPALRLAKTHLPAALVHRLDCSFCHHRRPRLHWRSGCPNEIACMKGIGVDEVLGKSIELLGRGT